MHQKAYRRGGLLLKPAYGCIFFLSINKLHVEIRARNRDMDHDTSATAGTASSIDSQALLLVLHDGATPQSSFVHALRLAVATRARLEIIDTRSRKKSSIRLGVRETLERWKNLEDTSGTENPDQSGLRVKKVVKNTKLGKEVVERLRYEHRDLLIVGTHHRSGIAGLFSRDVSSQIPNLHRQTTLYVPDKSRGFVEAASGAVVLKKILVAVAPEPPIEPALGLLRRLVRLLAIPNVEIQAVHCGETFPRVSPEARAGLSWEQHLLPRGAASVSAAITEAAGQAGADLIVMATKGRSSLAQRFTGSTTEQVVHGASCPVLAIAAQR
jgi:nucleotide-binding universal stress UspA family protein